MATIDFDRDAMARWYARQHLRTDPGVRAIYYLPGGAPDREIRLIEVNHLLPEMEDEALEPIDFGVDRGSESEHRLLVLDVTPSQWDAIHRHALRLPAGWSLEGSLPLGNGSR